MREKGISVVESEVNEGSVYRGGMSGKAMARVSPTTRPVGQVVKTAASHAVNIGSNPVRVTSSKQAADIRRFSLPDVR